MKDKIIFVFDLDGTLIDSVELHAKAFKYAVKKLGYKNYNELYKKFKKFVGLPIENIIKFLIRDISKKEMEKIKKLKNEYFLKNLRKVKINKKVLKVLKYLKSKGIKTALFTSSPKNLVKKVLNFLKLEKFFDFIICKEDVKKGKPNPEGLIKIMKKFKTKNVIFIGDSKFDKISAKRARVKFIHFKNLSLKKIEKLLKI